MKKPIIISKDLFGLWFSHEEIKFLNNWYDYYNDLFNGKIKPESNKQRTFIKIFNEKIKPCRDPIKHHSMEYQRLTLFEKTIIRYYYVQLYKEKIKSYSNAQGSDSIYYFSKAQLLFAKKVRLPYYLQNAEHYKKVLKKHGKL